MERIIIKQVDKAIAIAFCDIIFCKADKNYSLLKLKDKEPVTCSTCLTKLADDLNMDFLRISQSCIVNMRYIAEIHSRKKQVLLSTGEYLDFTIKYSDLCTALELRFKSQTKKESGGDQVQFLRQISQNNQSNSGNYQSN